MKNNIEVILKKLIQQRSYVPYENDALSFLMTYLKDRKFDVRKQRVEKNRYNLLAQKGNKKKSILVYMHLDTVLPVPGWSRNPLQLRREQGNYTGLGVFDMKGGIAALLSILDVVEMQDYSLKLVFGIDEEGLSKGVYALVESNFIKDVVVSFCPEACIIPKDWKLPVMFTIGGRGRYVFEVNIPGITGHGSDNSLGINAIEQAALCITQLRKWKNKRHAFLGESSFYIRNISGGNDALSIPDKASFEIDYHAIEGETPLSIVSEFKKFINTLYDKNILEKKLQDQFSVKIKGRETPYILPYIVSKNNTFVKLSSDIIKNLTGAIQYDYAKSVADQNVLVNAGIPTITVGPIGGNAHEANEWVSIKSLSIVASFYNNLFAALRTTV